MGSYQLDQHFHSAVALTLSDLDDTGVAAVTGSILCAILIKDLIDKVDLLGACLAACSLRRNLGHIIEDAEDLTSCMQLGGLVLFDRLLDFVIDGDLLLLAVDLLDFLDALALVILDRKSTRLNSSHAT